MANITSRRICRDMGSSWRYLVLELVAPIFSLQTLIVTSLSSASQDSHRREGWRRADFTRVELYISGRGSLERQCLVRIRISEQLARTRGHYQARSLLLIPSMQVLRSMEEYYKDKQPSRPTFWMWEDEINSFRDGVEAMRLKLKVINSSIPKGESRFPNWSVKCPTLIRINFVAGG